MIQFALESLLSVGPFEPEETMRNLRADQIKSGDPVWVWDAFWLPASVADVELGPETKLVIVRLENGCSASQMAGRRAPGS
jgi:hypothetical protein